MEEVDRSGVTAVFAADPEGEVLAGGSTLSCGRGDELADPVAVDGLERGGVQDALFEVGGQERGLRVVAGQAPGGLGQVVGAEGEEPRRFGDAAGGEGG